MKIEIVFFFGEGNDSKNLFICGQPGTGKTSLVMEIFNSGLPEIEFSFKIYINDCHNVSPTPADVQFLSVIVFN
jgi:broad-specificity NMP kinase